MGWLRGLIPPPPEADPKETLRWVRRMEIVGGVLALVIAATAGEGVWRWVLVGLALLSFSPWPGSAMILRKAERDPGTLVSDPAERRRRARRVALVQPPLLAIVGAVIGYLMGGVEAALWTAALSAGAAAVASLFILRM